MPLLFLAVSWKFFTSTIKRWQFEMDIADTYIQPMFLHVNQTFKISKKMDNKQCRKKFYDDVKGKNGE